MAGIQADPHLAIQLYPVDNLPDFLKAPAPLAALAGHRLQQHNGALLLCQQLVEQGRNFFDASLCPLAHMAAGVKIIVVPWNVLHSL